MRILALNWQDRSNPQAGGAEVHLEELLSRLVARGHEATLLCSGYKNGASEETIRGIRMIRRGSRYNFNLAAPLHLRRLVKGGGFDILFEDINKIPFYTPLFVKIPTLVHIPHMFSESIFRETNFVAASYVYLCELPLFSIYRGVKFNTVSQSTARDIASHGVPPQDISIVYNGVDETVYNFDPKVEKYDKPTILYLGRVKKYKSVDHVIRAYAKVLETIPEARLKIMGGGDYLDNLKRLAVKLGLGERVEFLGYVDRATKVEVLRRSHMAVHPSVKEGWGLTNIEANACGTAVIAADSPGLRDSVIDNETGYLYRYGDIDNLAAKIIKLLTDSETRARLEKGGLEWSRKFRWDSSAEDLEKLMESIVKGS